MFTTLNRIKGCDPCEDGWRNLLVSLNKTKADDAPVSIRHIIESNGIPDAIWALRAVDGHVREIRLYAAWCAEQVLPFYEKEYPNDNRPRNTIKAARDYANGLIDATAWAAAWVPAKAAGMATAWAAAWAPAKAAGWDAALDAARAAARIAARGAANTAAWATARDAAWAAARGVQKIELIRVCECIEHGIDPYPINSDSQP